MFEVQDQSHLKSKKWIEDISIFFNDEFADYTFIEDFCTVNPEMDRRELNRKIKKIIDIKTKDLGIIELSSSLDIDIVNWDYNDYRNKFLVERRKLMAKKIKEYYNNL